MKYFLLCIVLLSSLLYAKYDTQPERIYVKKCAMCHKENGPETFEEKKAMVAPPITLAMRSVSIGVDAIEEPKTKEELRLLVIEFLKDYIMNPQRDKSFCEDIMFERFKIMPSLKGFISQKELELVVPYVYDNFAPKK